MSYPAPSDYQIAIQNPRIAFRDPELRQAKVKLSPLGLPQPSGGTFALTYSLDAANGAAWVVRCFKREMPERQRRYREISAFLKGCREPFLLPVQYLDQEMNVNGQLVPIVKMPRVAGSTLGLYVEKHIHSPKKLAFLPSAFEQMATSLRRLGIAHGDLQHGNIMVDEQQRLVLIDYDGMYLPGLRSIPPNERGHENFQHPQRNLQYDEKLDHFSSIIIYLALKAVVARPSLFAPPYANGDNLLMVRDDFRNPEQSKLFRDIETIPELHTHIENLRRVCRQPYDNVPDLATFLGGAVPVRIAQAFDQPLEIPPGYAVLDAQDREYLLSHVGDVVTVVGKITDGVAKVTRYGSPYQMLNFGDYRQGCFTLVFWSEVLEMFEQQRRDVAALEGKWVKVTGLVNQYVPTWSGRKIQPQIIVEQPSQVQELSGGEAEADRLLGRTAPAPKPPPKEAVAPPMPKTTTPVTRSDRDFYQQLNALYKDKSATSQPGQTTEQPASAPQTPVPSVPATPLPAWIGAGSGQPAKRPVTVTTSPQSFMPSTPSVAVSATPDSIYFRNVVPDKHQEVVLTVMNRGRQPVLVAFTKKSVELNVSPTTVSLKPLEQAEVTVALIIPHVAATAIVARWSGTSWTGPAFDGRTYATSIDITADGKQVSTLPVEAAFDPSIAKGLYGQGSTGNAPGGQPKPAHKVWKWWLIGILLLVALAAFIAVVLYW